MNRNNLNWTDNRVLGSAGAAAPKPVQETGVSPATYQNMQNTGVSPATYQNADNKSGVSPATYQNKKAGGGMPSGYSDTGMPAPTETPWQDTAAAPFTGGASPAPTPGVGMQAIPSEPMMRNDTQGAVTRNGAYAPMPVIDEPGPPSVMDPGYIPGYLRTQIGKRVRAEFVFTNLYLDKTGFLREVGYNYFVLQDAATGAIIMCDLYSARFVTSI